MTSETDNTIRPTAPRYATLNDDPSSVYYLHNSDQPGIKLVLDVLTGDNYVAWSRSIQMALRVKNKTVFIDGLIKTPDRDSDIYDPWLCANCLDLKLHFAKSDGPRVFHLERLLSNLSQGNLSLIQWYNSFKTLWDEYINCRFLPKCVCGRCTCDVMKTLMDYQQTDSVLKFLVGLNESYSHLRSQILIMNPMPHLAQAYYMIMQEERQRGLRSSYNNESAAMMVNTGYMNDHSTVDNNGTGTTNYVLMANQPYNKGKEKNR